DWLDVSYHDTLMQAIGYLMTGDTSLQKMLVLLGASRGGKGTVTRVVKDLIGEKLQGSITLHDFGDSFGLQGILEKRLVVVPDASDVKLSNRSNALERIKSITGNDEISINRKHKPILGDVRLHTKLLLVANSHPKFLDESGALANREIPIEFDRSFFGKEDTRLGEKLRAELPGIANMAIAALRDLRANGGRFTIGRAGKAVIRDIERNTSPALRFAGDCLQITGDADDFIPHDAVFERYEAWAGEESLGGYEFRNRDDFRKDLKAAIGHRGVTYMRRRWRDPNDKSSGRAPRVWGWRGLRINRS
ncbi:MAG: hypothetical protein KDA71_09900, partial [Planctomycetales bacterium]|nr:hypothetical protein [Planctomycetales bacterium]